MKSRMKREFHVRFRESGEVKVLAATRHGLKTIQMKKWILIISITFNILFIIGWLLSIWNSPTYKIGQLEKDIEVGYFSTNKVLPKFPK